MSDCDCLQGCPFFNDQMADMPSTADAMKGLYCQGDNACCARFMVFKALGKGKAPADLFPSQSDRAEEIIRNYAGM
ncbi:MAG: hypothetical protein HPY53_14315 [Brevinematales bacterium]|nr:hypothetical protein [Brevinematales bacterium]